MIEILHEDQRNLIIKEADRISILPNVDTTKLIIQLENHGSMEFDGHKLTLEMNVRGKTYKFDDYDLPNVTDDLARAFIEKNEDALLDFISYLRFQDILRDLVEIFFKTNRIKFERNSGFVIDERYVVQFNDSCKIIDPKTGQRLHFCVVLKSYSSGLCKHLFEFAGQKVMIKKEMVSIISKINYILNRGMFRDDQVLWNQMLGFYPDEKQ